MTYSLARLGFTTGAAKAGMALTVGSTAAYFGTTDQQKRTKLPLIVETKPVVNKPWVEPCAHLNVQYRR